MSLRTATFGTSLSTRSAVHWCCGWLGSFMFAVYGNFVLNPGCNSRTEFFTDANGGAVAAAGTSRSAFGWSRCLPSGDAARRWHRQGGTGRSLLLRDQYPIGPGRSLRLRDSALGQPDVSQAGPVSASWCRGQLHRSRDCFASSSRIDAGGHSRTSVTSGPALVIHF